jgi:tetratricopeptide (TPR) repeat protein
MPTDEHERLVQLREKIVERFSDEEFRTLCFDLGVEYESLGGEGKAGKVRELVALLARQERLPELVRELSARRPRVEWSGAHTATFFNIPPLPPHALVGRDEQLAELRGQLMRGGAVAITALNGLPGVGKTTLAVMLAHDEQVRAHFTGGILWAGLGQNPVVDDVLNQWADALGADMRGIAETADRARAVQNAIAQHAPMLLVIDDAWSLEAAQTLNLACESCAVLLTTRSPRLAHAFSPTSASTLQVLSEEAALKMLAQFAPDACRAEPDDAQALVRAVGCLPLAIVLTGHALNAEAYARQPRRIRAAFERVKRVEERLKLEGRRAPGQAPVSLLAAIRISDEAIGGEAARKAFWSLGAFAPKPADFSEEAALAVMATADDGGAAVLDRLVDLGLLEVTGKQNDRYALHQEIANYCLLMQGDDAALRLRHAQYYLDWVNADPDDWRRIEPELEQIRAAWNHLQTLEVSETSRVFILDYVGAMCVFQQVRGLWREEIVWIERGLASARILGRRKGEGTLLNNIAWCYDSLGDPRRALEVYEQALPISREVGDRAGEATTLNNIGLVYDNLGERRRALEVYEQALPIRREVGDRAGEATTLNNIGAVYNALGERRRALEGYEQALPIRREVGDRAGEATTLHNIGAVYRALGDPRRALEVYEQALPIRREVGDREGESVTLFNIAMIHQDEGNHAEAVRLLEQVVALDEAIEHPDLESDRVALEKARRKATRGDESSR